MRTNPTPPRRAPKPVNLPNVMPATDLPPASFRTVARFKSAFRIILTR